MATYRKINDNTLGEIIPVGETEVPHNINALKMQRIDLVKALAKIDGLLVEAEKVGIKTTDEIIKGELNG
jgi:hypothetical protein